MGKSTLMNALVGERMSIITNKPQTTRHRIIGIVNDDDFQIVFSDTPGVINDPAYKMHEAMNHFVQGSFEDADLVLFVTEPGEQYADDDPIIDKLKKLDVPLFLLINKIDTSDEPALLQLVRTWNDRVPFTETIPISALHKTNTETVLKLILERLPEGPAYYPKDQLTDRPERFFVSEIIREKILLLYQQEVPYFTEVVVTSFKDDVTSKGDPIIRIGADIYVGRKTQKAILIGKGGKAIKKLGVEARKDIETWLNSKIYLELHVKVKDNWRDNDYLLKQFGYR